MLRFPRSCDCMIAYLHTDIKTLRRFAGRWQAVFKVLPYCGKAHFFDNYNGFVEVAEYVN